MVVGTVGYIPPEQVQRKGADHRAKFFAFGVILFEMLPGMRAFEGESGTALHLDGELARQPGVQVVT